MRILFVAAEAMEFEGVLERASGVRPATVSAQWARECRLGEHDALLVANGAGTKRAAAAARAGIETWRPEAVVSTGFCGALDPSLGIGSVVIGTDGPAAGEAARGVIRTVDHVVRAAEEKRKLRASGAVAVEMEAAGVADCARERGLPFFCVRAVTDLAGETLANDFQAALREDGHFDTIKVLAGALRHPSQRVPELLRLRRRCKHAARALGDFFVVCGF